MVSFAKYQDTVEQIFLGIHDMNTDEIRAVIHSDAPTAATDDELADLTQTTGTGYTAGGMDVTNTMSESGGTATVVAVDHTWTGGAGGFTAARYISIYNNTSSGDKLLGAWDYGGNFTVANTETFTVDYGASLMTLT